MGRDLDLDNCKNKAEAVIAAYEQELNENERKIVDEGAWAISHLAPDFDAILSAASTDSGPEVGA